MASPSLDGVAVNSNTFSITTSHALSLSTSVANDAILCFVSVEGHAQANVTSVTSANLTFTRRFKFQNTLGTVGCELWVAQASGTLSSENITVLLDSSPDGWSFSLAAFQNVNVALWDPNGSLPGNSTGGGSSGANPTVSGISTTNADDLVLCFAGGNAEFQPTLPSGYTSIGASTNFDSGGFSSLSWGYLSESSPQSGLSQVWASGSTQDYVIAADALTNDTVVTGVSGTLASTEATDTMTTGGPGSPTPPIVDATFGELTGGAASLTSPATFNFSGTNKTAGANETVVAVIAYNLRSASAPGAVSSVTALGLTFTHQFTVTNTTSPSSVEYNAIEVWTAPASSAFNSAAANLTYTIDWTSGYEVDNAVACVFAVEGLYSIVHPFDTDSPASAFNTTGAPPPTITFNTAQSDDLLIGLSSNDDPFGMGNMIPIAPTGWTALCANVVENSGLAGLILGLSTKSVTSPQLGATFADAATGSHASWTGLVIAFTSSTPPPPTGTWASTEAADPMAVYGGGISGNWVSTGIADRMNFSPFNGPYGVWESTEVHDTIMTAGIGLQATTFDPATATGVDFQNKNLTIVNQGAFGGLPVGAKSNSSYTTGVKVYAEFETWLFNAQSGVGIGNATTTFAEWGGTEGSSPGPATDGAGIFQNQNGSIWINEVEQTNWAGVTLNHAIVGVAIDLVANLIWFQTNGGHWNGIAGANPATGVGGYDISRLTGSAIYLFAVVVGAQDKVTMNAGASAFTYSVPSGFAPWNISGATTFPPLLLDGYATSGTSEVVGNGFAPVTTGTVTLTTTQHDDVVVLAVTSGGFFNTSRVTSVTDTAGLTWKRRNRRWVDGGGKSAEGSPWPTTNVNQGFDVEIWWAHAPTPLTGDVITVNTVENNGTGSISLTAFGVSGANYTTPWDTHTQAGGYIDNVGNIEFFPAMAQLSTKAGACFLFGIHSATSPDSGVAQAPWTYVTSATASEHNGFDSFESLIYQIVDEPQNATNLLVGQTYAGAPAYSAASVMFDSIVAAGETGTAQEIVWFWDANSTSNILQLSTGTTLTLGYTATNFNLMVLIQVVIQSASGVGEVISISEGQGLLSSAGFERRSRVVTPTVAGTIATEIWWGWMPMYTAKAGDDQIIINTSGCAAGDIVAAMMWGLGGSTGAFGLGDAFWDVNASLPAANSSTSDSPVPNATDISTTSLSTLLVAWTANNSQAELGYTDPYITLVQAFPNTVQPLMQFGSTIPPIFMGFEYLYEPGHATNETAEFLVATEPAGWLMIADAIAVGPPQPPTGAWASTDTRDHYNSTGFVPVQVAWHSTDHADDFTGAPQTVPFPGLGAGWLGWVAAYAAWHSNDKKDVMDLSGWVIGTGITGQIAAVETKDRLSFSNRSTVTGTWASLGHPDYWSSVGYVIPKGPPPTPIKRRLLIIT